MSDRAFRNSIFCNGRNLQRVEREWIGAAGAANLWAERCKGLSDHGQLRHDSWL